MNAGKTVEHFVKILLSKIEQKLDKCEKTLHKNYENLLQRKVTKMHVKHF